MDFFWCSRYNRIVACPILTFEIGNIGYAAKWDPD
nr:MAG TPA: hypothetical protein [Bacteriophage sp.]